MSEAIERSSSSVDIRTSFCFQAAECGTPLRYQGSLALASMQASLSPFSRAAVSTWRRAVAILSASGGRSGVSYNLGHDEHDSEGRVITLEFEDFYLVCVYTPNSQDGLKRLDYRMSWEDAFRDYLVELDHIKPVVICGDMNVAHEEIDLKNPKTNRMNPGFTDEERGKMTELLEAGFTDTFRYLYPELEGAYSWWSFRAAARERNVGWRIDYFLCSDRLRERIDKAYICPEIMGSDHCPVGLDLK